MEALKIAISIFVIAGFMALCLYGIIKSRLMVKRGRVVDAEVVGCEQKSIEIAGETGTFYEITVRFYGRYGEFINKTFQSEEPYAEGTIIRSRYIDKTDRFSRNADEDVKNNRGLWVIIGVLFFMLFLVIFTTCIKDENGERPQWVADILAYVIGILFMLIGFGSVIKQILLRRKLPHMQVICGRQADYNINYGTGDEPDTYQPVYEYELQGITYRYTGRMSGNTKKYRQIGRKVHMLRDLETGEVVCKEDEKSSGRMMLFFGIIGLLVFLFMLARSMGFLSSGSEGTSGHTANSHGITGREDGNDSAVSADAQDGLIAYIMYPMGQKRFSYTVEITENGDGRMTLFPGVTVEGKGIDQEIEFTVPLSDVLKIGNWIEEADVETLVWEDVDENDMFISVYVTEGDEKPGGCGFPDMSPYAELYELLLEVVPAEVWQTMQERETAYYQ